MRKFTIFVDMDSTLADMLQPLLDEYNYDYEDTLRVDDIVEFDIKKFAKPGVDIESYFKKDGFFEKLKPLPGAIEGLEALVRAGHEVIVASSHSVNPNSAAEKLRWLKEHTPFIGHSDVMLGVKKHKLRGDVFIDDAPHQAARWLRENPDGVTMSIKWPYNNVSTHTAIFNDWRNPDMAWPLMIDYIALLTQRAEREVV